LIAAVSGVHPSICEVKATTDAFLINDLLECEYEYCTDAAGYANARVVDVQDGTTLGSFCAGCLGIGAGFWATRRPYGVRVVWPFDGSYPADLGEVA
jgi:hypothetical protein